METRKVIDPKGEWFVNSAAFPLHDPVSGTVFEPNTPTQATATPWLKGQPAIKEWVDPTAAKPAAVKTAESKPAAK